MEELNEIWKPIEENPNYLISNLGNVKNSKTNKILAIQKYSLYSTISFQNSNKKRISVLIHRLVAKAFIPNPENKLTVNHINKDKYDNRVTNLEWATYKEQNEHNYKTEDYKRETTRARSVCCFEGRTQKIVKEFRSVSEAGEWLYNNSKSKSIDACISGIKSSIKNNWLCHSYKWEFTDLNNKDLEQEIWKEIPQEFTLGKKNYFISNKGRYKNEKGVVVDLKVSAYYKILSFKTNGKPIRHALHRLVALLFIPNPDNKEFVNHIDGNKLNNSADNLEWITKSENTKHAHSLGLITKVCRKINQYDKNNNFIAQFNSIKEASEHFSVHTSSIGKLCAGTTNAKYCCGYIFKYAD
jgi:hypothetical protein